MLKGTSREFAAEFLGTFIVICIGVGCVAQKVLSNDAAGSQLSINLGFGLAVMLGVYVAAGISGAHLNPAITLSLAVHRRFPWGKVAPYALAQTSGAFFAAAVVWFTYREALSAFDGGTRLVEGAKATAGIFATYPQPYLTLLGGLVDQIVGTILLMVGVLAVTDQRNAAPPAWLVAPLVGGLVVAIGMGFGFNAGYAINPARDFGPRLFTSLAGWGSSVFTAKNSYWWIPIIGPSLGATLGVILYDMLIDKHHPKKTVA